jgi:hypothetical protein
MGRASEQLLEVLEQQRVFWVGGAPNPVAREVKLADLRDNSDLSRMAEPTAKDRAGIEKSRRAIEYLEGLS